MELLQMIATFLGIAKVETKEDQANFSSEQEEKLKAFFGDKYDKLIENLNAEISANNAQSQAETALEQIRNQLNVEPISGTQEQTNSNQIQEGNNDVLNAIKVLQKKVDTLQNEPESSIGSQINEPAVKIAFDNKTHTDKHVYGIEHDFFSRDKWWNNTSATRKATAFGSQSDFKKKEEELINAFGDYAADISARYNSLQANGQLGEIKSGSINYTDLESQWGAAHYVRRQDALIAYLMEIPTVTKIFPVRYGVQDKEEMTNSFFEDFSQAYQSGEVEKGSYALQPELAQIYRAMFKHKFSDLKQLEKEHIGYLNREGSDPMKWTFIEWLMLQTSKKLIIEQDQRRIIGTRVEPTTGTPGHSLFASDGVLRKLQKYIDAFKLLPFTDLNSYTKSTILTYVESFVEKVNQILPGSLEGWKLHINAKHIPWYKAAFRETYGTDADFSGAELKAIDYSLDLFVPVPNMSPVDYRMWITLPGNIELLEPKAGEMFGVYFERRLEELWAASWWGEGVTAYMSGKEFTSLALLTANEYKNQFIFLNDPYTALVADATTADGSLNTQFKTIANTGATAITDITTPKSGRVYRITCGNTTNATTIAKTNKFSEITAAWTPTAVGDYLEVWWDQAADSGNGKFKEIARKVTT